MLALIWLHVCMHELTHTYIRTQICIYCMFADRWTRWGALKGWFHILCRDRQSWEDKEWTGEKWKLISEDINSLYPLQVCMSFWGRGSAEVMSWGRNDEGLFLSSGTSYYLNLVGWCMNKLWFVQKEAFVCPWTDLRGNFFFGAKWGFLFTRGNQVARLQRLPRDLSLITAGLDTNWCKEAKRQEVCLLVWKSGYFVVQVVKRTNELKQCVFTLRVIFKISFWWCVQQNSLIEGSRVDPNMAPRRNRSPFKYFT